MEIVSNIALITINETIIIQLVSFLIFLFLLNRIMIRPLQATMRERSEYVRDIESSISESNEKLRELQIDMEKKKRAAIHEANLQRARLEEDGSKEASGIMEVFRQDIDRIRSDTHKSIDNQVSEARKSLTTEAEALAFKIMEKILDRGVSRG